MRAFGARFRLDDRGRPLPIDPDAVGPTGVPAVFYEDDWMLRFLTAGESHGKALIMVIEGVPAGLPLAEDYIAIDLRRRQGGYGRGRPPEDRAGPRAKSSPAFGTATRSAARSRFSIQNRDWVNWTGVDVDRRATDAEVERVTRLRPGHADLAGHREIRLR